MDGWVDGWWSRVKDCLQKSEIKYALGLPFLGITTKSYDFTLGKRFSVIPWNIFSSLLDVIWICGQDSEAAAEDGEEKSDLIWSNDSLDEERDDEVDYKLSK